jgi:Flp pilus assembly protein TadG
MRLAARLGRGRAGMAAVEFAMILPLMLALYFGCVVLSQGLEVGRKTQALSRTLADLPAQTLPATNQTNPTLADTDFVNFFSSWSAVLYPFVSAGSPNMTISQVVFVNKSGGATCCDAKVVWSVVSGPSPTLRQCPTLTQSANGVYGATSMPIGLYPTSTAALTSGNNPYVIIADVNFTYTPSFGFVPFAWSQGPNGGSGYKMSQTTYMAPRNGATTKILWTPGGTIAASNYVTCTPSLP